MNLLLSLLPGLETPLDDHDSFGSDTHGHGIDSGSSLGLLARPRRIIGESSSVALAQNRSAVHGFRTT